VAMEDDGEGESFKKKRSQDGNLSFVASSYATALLAFRRSQPPLGLHQRLREDQGR
jgi:hypothetical protein